MWRWYLVVSFGMSINFLISHLCFYWWFCVSECRSESPCAASNKCWQSEQWLWRMRVKKRPIEAWSIACSQLKCWVVMRMQSLQQFVVANSHTLAFVEIRKLMKTSLDIIVLSSCLQYIHLRNIYPCCMFASDTEVDASFLIQQHASLIECRLR